LRATTKIIPLQIGGGRVVETQIVTMRSFMNPDSLDITALIDTTGVGVTEMIEISPLPSFGLMMFQIIFMLIVLSVVLYTSLYLFRRLNNKIKNKNELYSFRVHENIFISSKQGLSAVTFGHKLYIIGFSANSINVVDIIDDPIVLENLTTTSAQSTPKFIEHLKKYFSRETS
jgi:flagellar biogenesis protein FliO